MGARLVVATTNPHKIREIESLLAGAGVELIALDRWPGLQAPAETGTTFEENARLKALYYAAATGELVVAEDSGLAVDALEGAPGVESARFGGNITYPQRFALIYEALRARPRSDSSARFVCAVALARGREVLFETRATVEGRIAPEPRGDGGFGYDPIFWFPSFNCTLAQARADQKAEVSHRGKAFRALRAFLAASGR